MEPFVVPPFISFSLGMAVYFLGAELTRHAKWLRDYNIPEPVSGGLVVAVMVWLIYLVFDKQITFDLETRDTLLVLFFATIGLNARFSDLVRGGRPLAILLVLTLVFMVLQNVVALIGVSLFGLPSSLTVLVGSASLIGGHGTAIAWGPEIASSHGVSGASEIGIATATLGLIVAALVGGPIAQFLITRHQLSPDNEDAEPTVGLRHEEETTSTINYVSFMRALLSINVAVILGYLINQPIAEAGLKLPLFVPCLIMGIVITNLQTRLFPDLPTVSGTAVLALISEFSLSVFLAMSLMSMQLWTLAGLGAPLLGILFLQLVLTISYCILIIFPAMGGSYRAAVLGAGFGGFALGATPTAIANMTAVTKRHGPAPLAFLVLPLVSAFFVDVANAFVIQFFVSL